MEKCSKFTSVNSLLAGIRQIRPQSDAPYQGDIVIMTYWYQAQKKDTNHQNCSLFTHSFISLQEKTKEKDIKSHHSK